MISNQERTLLYALVNGTLTPVGSLVVGPNGTLIISSSTGGGSGSGSGYFDANGNPRIFDSLNNGYWTQTAPNGITTYTNFSTNP